MLVKISSHNKGVLDTREVDATEDSFYQFVGQNIYDIAHQIPDVVDVDINDGEYHCTYQCGKRGTFVKNGVTYPSMFVKETRNDIDGFLSSSDYEEKYLTCVNPESNNYKFYRLIPSADGIRVKYGRIGTQKGEMFGEKEIDTPYERHLFWIRYYEKLSKGYIDQSNIYLNSEPVTPAETKVANPKKETLTDKICNIFKRVSRQYVSENCISSVVTENQYLESRKLFNELSKCDTVSEFNRVLLKLVSVSPRRVSNVNDLLAESMSDMKNIIYREERLVNSMQTMVGTTSSVNEIGRIKIYNATDKQREEVMSKISDRLKPKVKNIYRVIDTDRKEQFDRYLKENNIHKIKQFWHGSKTENWYSILVNSLQLNPNASITGKMFGKGIYFAPSSDKSFNYTSYRGSYWAHGSDGTGFMGIYAVAYGTPYDTYTAESQMTESRIKALGKNCLHAHAGQHLYNDEVVVYNESACVLNYLVEFGD